MLINALVDRKALRFITVLVGFISSMMVWADESNDEDLVEELVVTGSYLKRTTSDSPSPLSVVSRSDFDQMGAVRHQGYCR